MSLGILVGRFGEYVRTYCSACSPDETAPASEGPWPEGLESLRACTAHPLIPLLLLSNSDGESAAAEQRIIVDHCVALAQRCGVAVGESERAEFTGYVASYRPSLMQLDPALRLVERDPPAEIAALLGAAEAVANADGNISPEETHLLADLKDEIAKVRA